MSDGSSNVTDAYAYDAWGNGLAHFGSAQQPYQYVGRLGYYAHYRSASADGRKQSFADNLTLD